MNYSILSIDAGSPELAQRLRKAGVRTTKTLLDRAKDPRGRKALAAAAGMTDSEILKFANIADLLRLKGVGAEYAELLEEAGVDTVKALKNRNPANLTRAIVEANGRRGLVRLPPSEKTVAKWIAQAKTLPPVMTY